MKNMRKPTLFIFVILIVIVFLISACDDEEILGEKDKFSGEVIGEKDTEGEGDSNNKESSDSNKEENEKLEEEQLIPEEGVCGDGVCNGDENCDSCEDDCGCEYKEICIKGYCKYIECVEDRECGEASSCSTVRCLFPGTTEARCEVEEIASCRSGDGCCPDGCEGSDDDCGIEELPQNLGGGGADYVPQCRDGIDNDNDEFIDFTNDSECQSADDNSESPQCGNDICEYPEDQITCPDDCGGVLVAACNDGIDNDGDGYTDYSSDTNCTASNDNSEFPFCGNGLCESPDENTDTCYVDCQNSLILPPLPCVNDSECIASNHGYDYCNDGVCAYYPKCSNNKDDDGDGFIDFPNDSECQSADDWTEQPKCGNIVCEATENYTICPDDCFAICGNSNCEMPAETPVQCPVDCS